MWGPTKRSVTLPIERRRKFVPVHWHDHWRLIPFSIIAQHELHQQSLVPQRAPPEIEQSEHHQRGVPALGLAENTIEVPGVIEAHDRSVDGVVKER